MNRKRSFYFLFVFIFSSLLVNSQASAFRWARSMGSATTDVGYAVASDSKGNVYTCGSFKSTADFDPGAGVSNLVSNGESDMFVSKLDSSGNFLWAFSMGGPLYEYCYDIKADDSCNIYVTGRYAGTVDFDPGAGTYMLASVDAFDIFVAKYDPLGNLLWAKSLGGPTDDEGIQMDLDIHGNVYVGGNYTYPSDFDPGPGTLSLPAAGMGDIFILKLDGSGNFQWAKAFGGSWVDKLTDIAVDKNGNVVATGYFSSKNVDFDPGTGIYTLSSSTGAAFVCKLDSTGAFAWAKKIDGGQYSLSRTIAVDVYGNVFFSGEYNGTCDFDPGPATYTIESLNNGFDEEFFVKLDASGNFLWAGALKGQSDRGVRACASDVNGNFYIGGYFWQKADFDPGVNTYSMTATTYGDIFILKLDGAGNFIWAQNWGGTSDDAGSALAADAKGSVYATGYFRGTADFDTGPGSSTLTSLMGSLDVFVLKLSDCDAPALPLDITPAVNKFVCTPGTANLVVMGPGSIFWYASYTSTQVLGAGAVYITAPSPGTYTFYAESKTCKTSDARTAITLTVSACTGIHEQTSRNGVRIYPNPVSDHATIEFDGLEEMNMTLFSVTGQVVRKLTVSPSGTRLERGELEQGVYFYTLGKGSEVTARGNFVVGD